MKFDEANESVKAFEEDPELEDWMPTNMVYAIIEGLREEYAPTVEMTKHQKFVFMRLHENKKPIFVDIDTVYNTPEFASIDTDLLILAWFHPEIIKVVDE